MSRRVPRGAAIGGLVALGVVLAALAGGRPGRDGPPLDPRSDGPLGTSALVSLLEGLGAAVDLSVGLPAASHDVALVLGDRLDDAQAAELAGWVERGGRLVVTDPGSPFTPPVVDPGLDSFVAEPIERARCTIRALDDVQEVDAGAVLRYDTSSATGLCFGDDSGAYVVTSDQGRGTVVAVGGAAAFTNDLLATHDNAVLAASLLAPEAGTSVLVVDPPVPAGGGQKSLSQLVSPGVRRGFLQLGIAFCCYALWRAIRLGRPVVEDQVVRIAGSELSAARGRLLARAGHAGPAADALRGRLRRALRARFGVPPSASDDTLASVVAARSDLAPGDVRAAIDDGPVTDDQQLLAAARATATLAKEVRP